MEGVYMISVGDAIAKAKSFVANQTGAPYSSLVLEAVTSQQVAHVVEFKEVADLGGKVYGHYTIEVDTASGTIKGFGKSGPNTPKPAIEAVIPRDELPEPQFEIVQDTDETYRFLLRTPTGDVIAVSKAYESKAGCLNGVKTVKETAHQAAIQDLN
jgi:uncharacterized protein YegP (UPF0339 family)